MTKTRILPGCIAALMLCACASNKPVVYPNAHATAVGQRQTDIDAAECRELALAAGANPDSARAAGAATKTVRGAGYGAATGVVGGAIGGNPGRGAGVGAATGATAGFLNSILGGAAQSNPAYRNFVGRCMSERGYDIVGWN